jgi:hypothetical protein
MAFLPANDEDLLPAPGARDAPLEQQLVELVGREAHFRSLFMVGATVYVTVSASPGSSQTVLPVEVKMVMAFLAITETVPASM